MKNRLCGKKDGNCQCKASDKCLNCEELQRADIIDEMHEHKISGNSEDKIPFDNTSMGAHSSIPPHEHTECKHNAPSNKASIIIEGIPDLNNDGVIDIKDVLIAIKLEIEKGDYRQIK